MNDSYNNWNYLLNFFLMQVCIHDTKVRRLSEMPLIKLYVNWSKYDDYRKWATNGKLFFKFRILGQKTKIFKWIAYPEYWSSKCNVLYMDLSRQALLQTNGKLLSNFGIIFRINYNFFKIIVALGLCMRGGGGICADQHAF